MRRFLIDTDTASDDAVALVMALRYPDVQVEAIAVVAGNVPLEQGVRNALYTVERCGCDVPVYRGIASPLLRPLETAQFCHGEDGMGDIGLPLSGRSPADGHAVDVISDTVRRFAGEITLVTLGPLSNIAVVLTRDRSIASMIDRCVIMGGIGHGYGNITPAAEYNIWVDPAAAKIVFASGLPITMVGWDVSHRHATFTPDEANDLRSLSDLGAFCIDIQKALTAFGENYLKQVGFDLPDPIAMSVALDPSVATVTERLHVEIETTSALTRGATVVDHLRVTEQEPNAEIVLEASRERFFEILRGAVRDPSTMIAVFGSINMDLIIEVPHPPKPGEAVRGGDLAHDPGGKGANQAVAAARLGADVAMLGTVGEDDFGKRSLDALRENVVDVSHAKHS
ncbi:MAG: PfkB family carbohydrate kinase [Candidatus Bipolaricaulia bacterium]